MNRSVPTRKLRREGSESLNTVAGLRQELASLRESTKEALQKSWAEVEQLQEEAMVHFERIRLLERDLELSRAREDDWKRQYEEKMTEIEQCKRREEEQLAQIKKYKTNEKEHEQAASHKTSPIISNHSFPRRPSNSLLSVMRRYSFLSNDEGSVSQEESQVRRTSTHSLDVNLQEIIDPAEGSDPSLNYDSRWFDDLWAIIDSAVGPVQQQDKREKMEAEISILLDAIDANKDKTINELKEKISGRDFAISELERNTKHQSKILRLLRSDVEKVRRKSAKREEEMAEEIKAQKKRVHEKKKIILDQMNQLKEFQKYISQLTEELERVSMVREGEVDSVSGRY